MDPLSERIGVFRTFLRRYADTGFWLAPEGLDKLDAMFVSFQVQARELEGLPPATELDDLCREAEAEAKAVDAVTRRLEATAERLREGNVIAFPPRGGAR